RLTAIRALFVPLQTARDTANTTGTAADVDALRVALVNVANAGFAYALPQSAVGAAAEQLAILTQQADAVLARAATLGTSTDDQLTTADATTGAEQKASLLSDAVKAWVGSDFLLLPRFAFPDAAAVAQADAARVQ